MMLGGKGGGCAGLAYRANSARRDFVSMSIEKLAKNDRIQYVASYTRTRVCVKCGSMVRVSFGRERATRRFERSVRTFSRCIRLRVVHSIAMHAPLNAARNVVDRIVD